MKCIDDELIQKFIDGETDSQETGQIEKHLAGCSQCARNVEEKRTFTDDIKRALRQDIGIIVPGFVKPVFRKRRLNLKIRHYIYAASAAAAVLLFLFLFPERKELHPNSLHLIYSLDGDFDSNKTVSQQEMIFIVIDADNKIVTF